MEKFMKLKNTLLVYSAVAIALSFVGCNLFNPTESVDIASDDANALTYEGYIKFRNNEYTEATKYFNMAIAADPSHSEAWFGLAKTKLNQQDLNIFELLKYINVGQKTTFPLSGMSDEVAFKYQVGIDTVVAYLKQFIYRDTTGQLDGVITYNTISNSYMILQMMQTMLSLRKTTASMIACQNPYSTEGCDLGSVLNSMKGNVGTTLETFHEVFKTCEDNPQSMASVADQYLQGFDWIADDKQSVAVQALCGSLAETTTSSGNEYQQEMALNTVISQLGYSDIMDDDGDGCIDEEIYDGEDNDGDGEIDEDIRDKTNPIVYDTERAAKNALMGQKNIKSLMIVKSAGPNEKYEMVDIDLNGKFGDKDKDEWDFIYSDYDKRVKENDHRFKFAENLVFNPEYLFYNDYLALKQQVAKDKQGLQFPLEYRKKFIGGCWVNYTEEDFQNWIAQRN